MGRFDGGLSRRRFIKSAALTGAGVAVFGLESCTQNLGVDQPEDGFFHFFGYGTTSAGEWDAEVAVDALSWQPGAQISLDVSLYLPNSIIQKLAPKIIVEQVCLLVTAERAFDADGIHRFPSHERMSSYVTPTGLAVEGGVQGAVTRRFGGRYQTPLDEFLTVPLEAPPTASDERRIVFRLLPTVPAEVPPGIYRLRLDFGVVAKGKNYSLAGLAFAQRPAASAMPAESHFYSCPFKVSGRQPDGRFIDASTIKPRLPWVILSGYGSNGYSGVVAEEDKASFALSPRNIIPDDVILPLYSDDNKTKAVYSLEPRFPTQTIEARNAIPMDHTRGEVSVKIIGPDGHTDDLGRFPFTSLSGGWPTTSNPAVTAWKPPAYGEYTVNVTGYVEDIWGNRYDGGGSYRFAIAKRMTLATATFQGAAFQVGGKYGRDLGFAPAVPADVFVAADLYPDSDPGKKKTLTFSGRASPSGIFGAAQGAMQLALDSPGEYFAHIKTRYIDQDGHLWLCSVRHAGVVYPPDSAIVAHGKKLTIGGKYVDRGETKFEGYVDASGENHLAHLNYPYNSGDVLLIGSEQQGANKIEPVLTYDFKAAPLAYEARWQTIGVTNVSFKTSNNYSPQLFPEFITDRAYFYAGAPRPGFMSRFIVGSDGLKAPYWPVSPNSFGGQINASSNGDLPGTIYRLIGGVALFQKGQPPAYAGYLASSFVMPGKSNNNRVIAPGAEELLGADGTKARLFLVSIRPGMTYETGAAFVPVAQIDPVLPAVVTFKLTYPDGRAFTAQGTGDSGGSFASKDRWTLDVPGVYRYTIEADWQGNKGYMPGMPPEGGKIFVIERSRLPQSPELSLVIKEQTTFSQSGTLTINGQSTGDEVHFAAVTPGAITSQGVIPVKNGKFSFVFDPAAVARSSPFYDVKNLRTNQPEVKRVIHLTLFSRERAVSGQVYHSFVRLIIRGTTVFYTY
ncbi:twin-arginine translocation signal domain-containing protein [Dehalogenimonas sp. 4OHTPN]|uniref:Twin-arginine translocation signal domain-containing protein n=1 Tax=Dehalogenimonas sp. 4OHTPN TaxID=3166643 RepID=A0AAU8GC75_9CHLR